ncbi:MAG: BRO family protein [Opitutaceae bacterium]|jgi:prophage antirepressor-like protein
MNTTTQSAPTVKVVSFLGHNIRQLGTADEPTFVVADAMKAAGLARDRKLFARLPEWSKGVAICHPLPGRKGGTQTVNVVTEAGLTYMALRSNKPQAQEFARWVCCEVLPAIRKYGLYVEPGAEAPKGTLRRTRAMARLAACREALQRDPATRPADTQTIGEFLAARGLSLRKGDLMRFSRRAWCAAGQRYDAPRLYLGAQRFPVLYPPAALAAALKEAA